MIKRSHITKILLLLGTVICLTTACVRTIDISRFIPEIDSQDAQDIEKSLPSEVVIAVEQSYLVDGVNPARVYATLGGLQPVSSNESVVRVERRNDYQFYIIGVAPGQATVHVKYMNLSKAINILVEQTLIESIEAPSDYVGQVRDSVVFTYGVKPDGVSSSHVEAFSDSPRIRVHADDGRLTAYALDAGTAAITLKAGDVCASFSFTAVKVYADSIRFEIPIDTLRHRIDSYSFAPDAYRVEAPDTSWICYRGVPNDFYRQFYKAVQSREVVRRTSFPFVFHIGVYPLDVSDYTAVLEPVSVHYVTEYASEYGRDGTLIPVEPQLWYKYFTLTESTEGGRFNEYSIVPRRKCVVGLRAVAGALSRDISIDFRLDATIEDD